MEQDVSLASLEAQVAPEQLTRAEPAEENHVVETEAHAVQWLHRRNGETAVFGCFLKFEVADSRQTFRAACPRF